MDTEETNSLLNEETPAYRKYQELFHESDDGDSFPEIECDLCSKIFPNVKTYEQHLKGKKHHQMLTKTRLMRKIAHPDSEENEDTNPESIDELHCDICEKTCGDYKSYVSHMKGSIHARNVKKHNLRESLMGNPDVLGDNGDVKESEEDELLPKRFARCSVCEKLFYDPTSYQQHMKGSSHKKKMLQKRTLEDLKSKLQDFPEIEDEEFFAKCDVCNKKFSGPIPFKVHCKSSVHENQTKRVQAMEKLKDFFHVDSTTGKMVCNECKKMFTDPFAFKQHLDNNSHEKQKVKDKVLEFVAAYPEIVAMKSIENISSEEDSEEIIVYKKGYFFLACKLCHVSFSGLENATDHVLSKKHIATKDEKKNLKLLKKQMKVKEKALVNSMVQNGSATTKSETNVSQMDTNVADNNEL